MNIFNELAQKMFNKELEDARIIYKALPRDVKFSIIMDVYKSMDTSSWKDDMLVQYRFIPQTSSQHKEVLDNAFLVIALALNKSKRRKGVKILTKKLNTNEEAVEKLVLSTANNLNVSENELFFNTVDFYKNHNEEIFNEAKTIKQLFWSNRSKRSINWLKNEIDEYLAYNKKSGEEAEKERENINKSLKEVGAYSNLQIVKALRHLYYNNSATQMVLNKYSEEAKSVDRQNVYRLANGRSVKCFIRQAEKSI